jgi:DNA (cytosine-5)-methyltransferase 1
MKSKSKSIDAVDMFCGAGGTSSGLLAACKAMGIELNLIAINHWPVAIDTHRANHAYAQHLCSEADDLNPRKLVPSGRLHVLVASPECTHHSNVRGGRPMSDQSRATAWHVLRWAEALYIENILIENVKEFRSWGPLGAGGRPIKKLRGQLYIAFIESLKALGYRVEDRVLCAADYGDPTTRERLFLIARRGSKSIVWPSPTHASPGKLRKQGTMFAEQTMLSALKPWRSAREIIDWSIPGKSIFDRKRPLAPKTLARIAAGLKKFGGVNAEPFLVVLRRHADAMSLDKPLPALTAKGTHFGVCEPFVIGQQSGAVARSVNDPIPTVATDGAIALVESFILPQFGGHQPKSLNDPLGTVTTTSRGVALIEPFLMHLNRDGDPVRTVDEPMQTVTAQSADFGLVEPFNLDCLVEPFLMDVNHGDDSKSGRGSRAQSVDQPLSAVTTRRGKALVDPFLVKYNGTAGAQSMEEPLDTVSTRDRFGLVETESGTYRLDIRFRMLEPHELAAAQGLAGYKFTGKKTDVVKQIGNAVPKGLATALTGELLA